MHKLIALSVVFMLLGSGPAAAATPAVVHIGPIASTSPDSGTCGTDWANDTFDRHYTIYTRPNADGSFTVVEEFKNGSFVTVAGASPGGCDTNPGGTVAAGVTGTLHGSFKIVVTGGTLNLSATCPAPCFTADFVAAFFGPSATRDIPTFLFHYAAAENGEWKNASADRGGNHGDITGTP